MVVCRSSVAVRCLGSRPSRQPGCASPAPSKQPQIGEPRVTRAVPLGGRPSPGCGRAALGTVLHAPELWEIAAAMLPRSSGAVGDGTRDVAHVLRRVAGHRSAVATSYLVRFFT